MGAPGHVPSLLCPKSGPVDSAWIRVSERFVVPWLSDPRNMRVHASMDACMHAGMPLSTQLIYSTYVR